MSFGVQGLKKLLARVTGAKPAKPLTDELQGAPAVRRVKTYQAESGYVYQHYFLGYRERDEGREYVFEVSADRKNWFRIEISLGAEAATAWERERERTLASNERYAIAKLALFRRFDESGSPDEIAGQKLRLGGVELRDLADHLDL